jgi:hypothetical protein
MIVPGGSLEWVYTLHSLRIGTISSSITEYQLCGKRYLILSLFVSPHWIFTYTRNLHWYFRLFLSNLLLLPTLIEFFASSICSSVTALGTEHSHSDHIVSYKNLPPSYNFISQHVEHFISIKNTYFIRKIYIYIYSIGIHERWFRVFKEKKLYYVLMQTLLKSLICMTISPAFETCCTTWNNIKLLITITAGACTKPHV